MCVLKDLLSHSLWNHTAREGGCEFLRPPQCYRFSLGLPAIWWFRMNGVTVLTLLISFTASWVTAPSQFVFPLDAGDRFYLLSFFFLFVVVEGLSRL